MSFPKSDDELAILVNIVTGSCGIHALHNPFQSGSICISGLKIASKPVLVIQEFRYYVLAATSNNM